MSKAKRPTKRILISFDYAFKRLLRNKANYDVLEGFLSELLNEDIHVKTIGESESNKEHKEDKYNKVDILVEDKNGEILLIELQFTLELDYLHRMLYGVSKTISERMSHGEKYMDVKKIYSINIVYFDLGQGDDYVYHGKTEFKGLHTNNDLQLTKLQQETFKKETVADIYPEYYILKVNSFDGKAKSKLDEWIYFFKNNEIKDEFTARGLEKAKEILVYSKLSVEEKRDYNSLLRIRQENTSSLNSAKDTGLAEGKKLGIAEGIAEGIELGIAEGIAEGIELGRVEEKESVVVESFKSGLSYEIISAITKLSNEKIISILKKNVLM
ncbi:MAG: Rpn family recombination-promoting nuclease/putative transposase [Bacteroidales bacterium]|jgi:predicted transposase/invertase (TIGR01784 family)|nr:Rpn family recombination-promoting nuclease/putative transposase [Bacteroidales bacterium]